MYINIYKFNISKVKKDGEYERYDCVLCILMWFKYIFFKSSGSYNRRGWVNVLITSDLGARWNERGMSDITCTSKHVLGVNGMNKAGQDMLSNAIE